MCAVIEAKLLSGLGAEQLERYRDAVPGAKHHVLLSLGDVVGPEPTKPPWISLTWAAVVQAYVGSDNDWVAQTAQAWWEHLTNAIPHVDADTVWNDIAGDDLRLPLRVRTAWIEARLATSDVVRHDIVASSKGGRWVARLFVSSPNPGYRITADLEEYSRPRAKGTQDASDLKGPTIRVMLVQDDVETSADFDWSHLARMWPAMESARLNWVTNDPRPRTHDKEKHASLVEAGLIPKHVGIGFGDRETKRSRQCMFGARIQYPPNVTLGELLQAMRDLVPLLEKLAAIKPLEPSRTDRSIASAFRLREAGTPDWARESDPSDVELYALCGEDP